MYWNVLLDYCVIALKKRISMKSRLNDLQMGFCDYCKCLVYSIIRAACGWFSRKIKGNNN